MDVIFAAINKFFKFLSGFSHTHGFCYQPINLCLRHCEIIFPWMECWPKWGENNVVAKVLFSSSGVLSTPSRAFLFPLLFFRFSYFDGCLELARSSKYCPWRGCCGLAFSVAVGFFCCCWVVFFSLFIFFSYSREDLTVGQMEFEKSEVQQIIWSYCCLYFSSTTSIHLAQFCSSVSVQWHKKCLHNFSSNV